MNKKILTIVILILILIKPVYTKFVEINMCLDMGICAKGIKIKIDENLVEINKENCQKFYKVWIEESQLCKIK